MTKKKKKRILCYILLQHYFLAQERIMHIVYTGISHVTAMLLVVWARFGFTVGLADNELPFILNGFSWQKGNLCAVELVKLVPDHSAHLVAQAVGSLPDLLDACWWARHWTSNTSYSCCWMWMDGSIHKFGLIAVLSQALCACEGWEQQYESSPFHLLLISVAGTIKPTNTPKQTVSLKGKFKVVND